MTVDAELRSLRLLCNVMEDWRNPSSTDMNKESRGRPGASGLQAGYRRILKRHLCERRTRLVAGSSPVPNTISAPALLRRPNNGTATGAPPPGQRFEAAARMKEAG